MPTDDEQARFGGGHDVLVLQLKQRPLLQQPHRLLELRANFTRSRRLHGLLFVRHRPSFALGLPSLFVQGLPRIHLAATGSQPATRGPARSGFGLERVVIGVDLHHRFGNDAVFGNGAIFRLDSWSINEGATACLPNLGELKAAAGLNVLVFVKFDFRLVGWMLTSSRAGSMVVEQHVKRILTR